MLMLLAEYLETELYSGFRVFRFATMRGILGALTALTLSFAIGPYVISRLSRGNVGQPIREIGPESHLPKAGTPTMGGALILVAIMFSTLLWADPRNRFVWIVLGVVLAFGIIGFIDDYLKLKVRNSKGLSVTAKLLWQSIAAIACALVLYYTAEEPAVEHALLIPYFPNLMLPLPMTAYVVFVSLMIVFFSNAVNLTDGLDGLAIMPTVLVGGALGLLAWVSSNINVTDYLGLPFIPDAGEMLIFCAALAGAGLGFLWFNTYPAQVFMGDVGALALGAALAVVAVVARQELVLLIMGGVFVVEAVSVMIQVASYKMTGRRIFRMAPLHHHFELKGWAEPQVTVRFWIITVILVLVGLASLKVR